MNGLGRLAVTERDKTLFSLQSPLHISIHWHTPSTNLFSEPLPIFITSPLNTSFVDRLLPAAQEAPRLFVLILHKSTAMEMCGQRDLLFLAGIHDN